MDVKAFVAQRSIERLDEVVICWLAWPAKVDLGLVVIGPEIEHLVREFTAIIDKQIFRCWPLADNPVQCSHDILAPQAMASHDGERFSAEDIDDCQQPYGAH